VPENGSGAHLVLDWQEANGPPVTPSTRVGYGTSVIRDLVPYELGGKADLAFPPEGACCRLQIPARWLSRNTQHERPVSNGADQPSRRDGENPLSPAPSER
jgi:hypothetical protein